MSLLNFFYDSLSIFKLMSLLDRTLCVITLPVGVDDPLDRVAEVSDELERQKRSSVPLAMFCMGPIMGALPAWFIRLTFRNYATTTVIT